MVLFSPQEIRKGNLVCQSHTQKTSWSAALILNTLSRVTELKEITESFFCEFWHDSQQTFPHLNSQERLIIKGRACSGPLSPPGCPERSSQGPAALLSYPDTLPQHTPPAPPLAVPLLCSGSARQNPSCFLWLICTSPPVPLLMLHPDLHCQCPPVPASPRSCPPSSNCTPGPMLTLLYPNKRMCVVDLFFSCLFLELMVVKWCCQGWAGH